MKKLLLFSLVAIFCLSLAMTASANPYANMYESDARMERQAGVAKNIYVVYDENNNKRTDMFTVFYMDNSQTQKQAVSNSAGKAYINFTSANNVQITLLQIGDVNYQIVGDSRESISAGDVNEGDVNYFVLRINRSERMAYIYDAD